MRTECSLSATELSNDIRSGARSPVDVVEAYLKRIEERNDRTTAYVTVCGEQARRDAERAEEALERGESLGPLHGVPVAIKDLTDVKGVRTTYGSKLFADHVPDADDTVVKRLREAGAIILGKTNTPEFGRKTVTDNPLFGASRNPWDVRKVTGGSSGGSAAAVADRLAPIALGTDAAGSLRIPSAACGTFGMMPDFGRVARGPNRLDPFLDTQPFTYNGPMARTAADAALLLDAIAGPHHADPYCIDTAGSYVDALDPTTADLDIAYSPNLGEFAVSTDISDRIDEAIGNLERAGATVTGVDPDFENSWEEMQHALETILQTRYVAMYDNFKQAYGIDLLETDVEITPEIGSRIQKGKALSALDFKRAERIRAKVHDAVAELVSGYDVLVTPTLSVPAFDLDASEVKVDGKPVHPNHGWMLTWPFNLSGNPAASLPIGFTDDGLPIGMQVIGSRLDDRTVLGACSAFERVLSLPDRAPPA